MRCSCSTCPNRCVRFRAELRFKHTHTRIGFALAPWTSVRRGFSRFQVDVPARDHLKVWVWQRTTSVGGLRALMSFRDESIVVQRNEDTQQLRQTPPTAAGDLWTSGRWSLKLRNRRLHCPGWGKLVLVPCDTYFQFYTNFPDAGRVPSSIAPPWTLEGL